MSLSSKILKCLMSAALMVVMPCYIQAQANAFFSHGTFNTPGNSPYIETYLTIVGKSLGAKPQGSGLVNSVHVSCVIYKDSNIVKASKYNLTGPVFSTASLSPSFIDVQRYPLNNGIYEIELVITDRVDTLNRPLTIKDKISIAYTDTMLCGSVIQPLESFKKSSVAGPLTKSGYDLVPYNVNYYPESTTQLTFYFEAYNTARILGPEKPFLFTWYLETSDTRTKLNSYGSFRKQVTAPVNPVLGKLDISTLGSGGYNLVVEVTDASNKVRLREKYSFERVNRKVDLSTLQKSTEDANLRQYFGNVKSADTLKMFVECLWPIANGIDKERIINQAVKKDPELMKKFVIDFWERRAADTASPLKLWAAYYKNVQTVMALFRCGKQPGYYSERGRVYLQYGPPNQRSEQPMEPNTFPYEIWQYYRLTDGTNGQFFSNRKFVFVNKNLGDDCHTLVHSDLRGELYNPRWQFEVTRRNTNGYANPDNTVPAGTQYNQFNEIYSNPR